MCVLLVSAGCCWFWLLIGFCWLLLVLAAYWFMLPASESCSCCFLLARPCACGCVLLPPAGFLRQSDSAAFYICFPVIPIILIIPIISIISIISIIPSSPSFPSFPKFRCVGGLLE